MLEGVLERLANIKSGVMPVTREGQLVGLLTLENIGELIMIQGAMQKRQATPTVGGVLPDESADATRSLLRNAAT